MELHSFHAIFFTQLSKTRGVLSPILFSIHIDALLRTLQDPGLGCHIGRTFADALGYVDDLYLVSLPSLSGLRQMVQVYEQYTLCGNCVNLEITCINVIFV